MLTDSQILEMVSGVELSPEKLAEILNLIYTDIMVETENLIEFRLAGLNTEKAIEVIVPDSQQLIGRMPWYLRKKRLEEKFKKISEAEPESEEVKK